MRERSGLNTFYVTKEWQGGGGGGGGGDVPAFWIVRW